VTPRMVTSTLSLAWRSPVRSLRRPANKILRAAVLADRLPGEPVPRLAPGHQPVAPVRSHGQRGPGSTRADPGTRRRHRRLPHSCRLDRRRVARGRMGSGPPALSRPRAPWRHARQARRSTQEADGMRRPTTVLREVGRSDQARRLATWLNPVMASPAAPRETVAALDALGPSLMPRTSRLQGVAVGLSVLGARATSGVAERLTGMVAPADAPLRRRLVARAAVGGAGAALAAVPERDGQQLWVASVRSTGLLLRDSAAGGAVHDLGRFLQRRFPSRRGIRPLVVSTVSTAGLLYRAGRRLAAREAAVECWPLPQTSTLPGALATSFAVRTAGTGLAWGFSLAGPAEGLSPTSDPGGPSGCWPGWSTPACGPAGPPRPTAPASPTSGAPTTGWRAATRSRPPARLCRGPPTACCRSPTSASRDAGSSPTCSPRS
jgi:hypothetical protein